MRDRFQSSLAPKTATLAGFSALLALGGAAIALGCSSSGAGSTGSSEAGTGASEAGAPGAGSSTVANGGAQNVGGMSMSQSGAPGGGGMSTSANGGAPAMGGAPSNGGAPASMGGAGGGTPGITSCPAPPAGAPANAVAALDAVNTIRLAMGVECANLVLDLDKSSQAHCDYYAANTGITMCESDTISAHDEVTGCTGFTGADPGARVSAAGYKGMGWSEVMAFNDDPNKAIAQWVGSVWHRTPLLSPWWDDMGYGNAAKCDVTDQGPGKQSPSTATAMYPYPGQTGVARTFNGAQEGPEPPTPPTGWPSGLPITLYVRGATTVSHSIEVMGSGEPLTHQWIDYNQPQPDPVNDSDQLIMYADKPLTANTTYHVNIAVTIGGAPKAFDWTFTTGS